MSLSLARRATLATQPAKDGGTPAKRGDIVLYSVIRSSTAANFKTTRTTTWSIGEVTHVTRDGLVRACRQFEQWVTPPRWREPYKSETVGAILGAIVASADRFDRPVSTILESIPDEYESIDAARDALRPFLKKSV